MINKTERILAINQIIRFIEEAYALIDSRWHSESYKKQKDECIYLLEKTKEEEIK